MDEELKAYMDAAAALVPRADQMDAVVEEALKQGFDAQLAPLWRETLRHTYTKLQEVKYPALTAANGGVLPIDSSVPAGKDEYESFIIDDVGFADWIDDSGMVMPTVAFVAQRLVGTMDNIGAKWEVTKFDLERAAQSGGPLSQKVTQKAQLTRKAHARTTNWLYLFGDPKKNILGFLNHPNIQVGYAAAAAGGSNSRKWTDGDKTEAEIGADIAAGVNAIFNNTLGAYHCRKVWMGPEEWQYLRDTRPAGDRYASLLDLFRERYKPDGENPGVEFAMLNECNARYRKDPRTKTLGGPLVTGADTGTDTSGLSGSFLMFAPEIIKDEAHFVQARRYTQEPPQMRDLVAVHNTHSKPGGCRLTAPTSFFRLDGV